MTDPGLSNRLRQHSRRSGLMVGLSMAAAIAILVGVFVGIYAALVPWLSDIVPPQIQAQEQTPTAAPAVAQSRAPENPVAPTPNAIVAAIRAQQSPTAVPVPAETVAPEPTETPEAFEPDFQIRGGQSINFRSGPSTNDPVIEALPPLTPLQYLNEEEPTQNPAQDGDTWRRYRTEDNQEGWVREIDTEPYRE